MMENFLLLKGEKEGMPFWNIAKVSKLKAPLLQHRLNTDEIDIEKYATIVESGWGSVVPDTILKRYFN